MHTLYSAFLLSALRVSAHGRLVIGEAAQDIPMLHRALLANTSNTMRKRNVNTVANSLI